MYSPAKITQIRDENYRFLQRHIYAEIGIVLEDDKHYLVETRLAPVAHRFGLTTLDDLCVQLMNSPPIELGRQVLEAMTTNETYFFRDPAQYEAIRTELLPLLIEERSHSRKLRFWSAAASTGQEAYSLAMLLLQAGLGDWDIQIFATDFSSQTLERARAGKYLQFEVNRGLPAALLVKHFRRADNDWQLRDEVLRMVTFKTIDLRKPMTNLGPFDAVFCRNVMIYFDSETRKPILRQIHGTLFRGGWLLLGGAENALGSESCFQRQSIGKATVYIAR
jgi:chemotaxis protein methyltransferase CheR